MEEFFRIISQETFKIANVNATYKFYIRFDHGDRSMMFKAVREYQHFEDFTVIYYNIFNREIEDNGFSNIYQVTLENPFPEINGTKEDIENVMRRYCTIPTYNDDGTFEMKIFVPLDRVSLFNT